MKQQMKRKELMKTNNTIVNENTHTSQTKTNTQKK